MLQHIPNLSTRVAQERLNREIPAPRALTDGDSFVTLHRGDPNMRTKLVISLVLWAQALPAAAEEPELVTQYRFEDTLVGGDGYQPGLEVLHARRRPERDSLVRVREHFVVELLKSVERL